MDNKKKLPKIIVVTIVLSIASFLLLIISILTNVGTVKRAENAIANIGTVTFEAETEEKIDIAKNYYANLDTNIGLEKNVSNKDELYDAIYNYVRLGIKKAVVSYNRRIVDNVSEADIKIYVNNAYTKLKKYYEEKDFENIEGYSEFKALLDVYKEEEKESNNTINPNPGTTEEPEIC